MKEAVTVIGGTFIIFIFAVFIISILANKYEEYSCKRKGELMGKQSYYSMPTRCMVKDKNEWIPMNSLRTIRE